MGSQSDYEILSTKEIQALKNSLVQRSICPLCLKHYSEKHQVCLDHQHALKSETLGKNGAGLIRGVLCANCNFLEGKIWNNCSRYQIANMEDPVNSRIEFLERLIGYYKNNFQHERRVLHPSEKRVEKLPKSLYNKLNKLNRELGKKPLTTYTGRWNQTLRKLNEILEARGLQNT